MRVTVGVRVRVIVGVRVAVPARRRALRCPLNPQTPCKGRMVGMPSLVVGQ